MSVNHALRQARQLRGWSQAWVAAQIETSAKNVSRWERSTTRPSPYFQTRLCLLFDTDAQTLGLLATPSSAQTNETRAIPVSTEQALLSPIQDPALSASPFSAEQVIGRDALLPHVLSQLQTGHLCALFGLPGVGKTTLAHLIAHHETVRGHFPDGVLWVGLGPSPDVISALMRWATVLSIPDEAVQQAQTIEALQSLLRHAIGTRRMLLIVDDAWSSEAALPFLRGGSHCGYLLTTRFPQLALLLTNDDPISVTELNEAQTASLLIRLAPPLSTMNAHSLHQLFTLTGGLPLAVTLVGKYLRLHAYSGQPRRLQAALASLTDASTRLQLVLPTPLTERENGRAGETSRSLQTVIAVSDQRLSPQAHDALCALSVLPAKPETFTEAAALFVCQQEEEVLDQLSDAGLLESAGPGCYSLHQTIADYARVHCETQEPGRRLVQYGCDLCQKQHESNITMPDQDYATVLMALEQTIQQGWLTSRLQLVDGLGYIWLVRCLYTLGEQHVTSALEAARVAHERRGIIEMCLRLEYFVWERGDNEQVVALLQEALPLAREEAPDLLHRVLIDLGHMAYSAHNLKQAEDYWQEARLLIDDTDTRALASLLHYLGLAAQGRGQIAEAEHYHQQCLTKARQLQDADWECMAFSMMGEFSMERQSKQQEAEWYYQQSLLLAVQGERQKELWTARCALGELARRRGDIQQAEQLLHDGIAFWRQLGNPLELSRSLNWLALLMLDLGKEQEAHQLLQEAIPLAKDIPEIRGTLLCTWGACLLQQQYLEEAEQQYHCAHEELPLEQSRWTVDSTCMEIDYGLARIREAQGKREEARRLAEESLARMEAIQYWKTDEVRQWLTRCTTREVPAWLHTGSSTRNAPHERHQIVTGESLGACPRCGSTVQVTHHGLTRAGNQRFVCGACGCTWTQASEKQKHRAAQQALAHELATTGLSQRAIARHLGVHHTTVMRWLTVKAEEHSCQKNHKSATSDS